MKTGSKSLIRDINNRLVLEEIINSGPISRATISKNLGLTKATISVIVQELIEKDLVKEIGSDDTSLGRKPILLSFNQNCGYAISIDIGVDNISILITNLLAKNSIFDHVKTPKTTENIVNIIIHMITSMTKDYPHTTYSLVGITLGIHGVTSHNNIVFAPYYDFSNTNIAKELEEYYGVPVCLENEANLSVIGEKTFVYDYPNIANISVHSGIGLGIIINHKLYIGYSGHAGEFGHTIIDIDGRECPCGNHGCLEQYVSERALLQEFACLKGLDEVDFNYLSSMYQTGDPQAMQIFDKFTKYMSICVNNVVNAFNPDIVVINSAFTVFYPELTNIIEANLTSKMNNVFRIVPSVLEGSSILLGGICITVKNFLGINVFNLDKNGTLVASNRD